MSGRRKVERKGLVDIGAIADVLGNIFDDILYYRTINAPPDSELLLALQELRRDVLRMLEELKK